MSTTENIGACGCCALRCDCSTCGDPFVFCDIYYAVEFPYNTGCQGIVNTPYDIPCFGPVRGGFDLVKLYFGKTSQGYPFSRQLLKDEAVDAYDNAGCSFAFHACQKIRSSSSRCMRGEECICLNGSSTESLQWYVLVFDCNQEKWVDVTGDILSPSREVFQSFGPVYGPANNCSECEWDNGNPPPPPSDPGACHYDTTPGQCSSSSSSSTGSFP